MGQLRFHHSAFKHGIDRERIRHVVRNCPCPLYPATPSADDQDLVLFLGPDQHGVPLEVVALELADESLLVIHAMKLRLSYAEAYATVMRCLNQ